MKEFTSHNILVYLIYLILFPNIYINHFLKDLNMNFSFCLIFLFTFVLYVLNTFQGLSLM